MSALLPCPFCGGPATLVKPATGRPYPCCDAQFCTGPKATAAEVIAAWNTRSRTPLETELIEALQAARTLMQTPAGNLSVILAASYIDALLARANQPKE